MNLPKRVFKKLVQLEKKIMSYPIENKINDWKQKRDDKKMNRELVGVDKYGNRYYQHYSAYGIPTKKMVNLNFSGFNKWEEDPTMQGWLQGRREQPPSQEELEKIYIFQENLERKGLEYDKKEQKLIEEYSLKRKRAIEKSRSETGAKGIGVNYEPGSWLEEINTSLTITQKNELAELEIPKWDVTEYKNMYGLTGKYYVDFDRDDIEYRNQIFNRMMSPLYEKLEKLDPGEFTQEKLIEQNNIKEMKAKQEFENKKLELTNLGKKMLEKKTKYKSYDNFRKNYKDIFEEFK